MGKAMTKDLMLEGLDCPHCAMNIEQDVGKLPGVSEASINFATKVLSITLTQNAVYEDVLQKTEAVVRSHEPGVVVREKMLSKQDRRVLILTGLDCANCAALIEKGVRELDGVRSATVDFATGRLTMEIAERHNSRKIMELATQIARQIQQGVQVAEEGSAEEHDHDEHDGFPKIRMLRFALGAAMFAIAMLLPTPPWVRFALYFSCWVLVGADVVLQAARNLLKGRVFDENFLMSVATIGAFAIGEYPEGAAVMVFYQIGEFFQHMAVNRSRRSIKALMDIRPDYANILVDGQLKRVSPDDVAVGERIVVQPGERIPLDGRVTDGRSSLDTSALTGESMPRDAGIGDDVLSGSINGAGLLTIEVTRPFAQSTVSKILDLVQNAGSRKAPTEAFITKFARYYTPAVVFAALALAVVPPLITGEPFSGWINRALAFLVVSCPCALVISIPLSFFGGIGSASKNGILIKGSNYLEALNRVDTVVFDKTGTLTQGVFQVIKVVTAGSVSRDELLEYTALAESYSSHPIAQSIQKAYGGAIDRNEIEAYDEISGHGIRAQARGKTLLAGNDKLMIREQVAFEPAQEIGTITYLAVDGQFAGYLVIADQPKPDARETISRLRRMGVRRLVMLTGDSQAVGQRIGAELGLDEVHTQLLPDQKVERLEALERQRVGKGKLVFVGDGINDAPVLARSDVGVAMGALGSDAAIEAADIVLMTDEPSKLATAMVIAKRTRAIVWQNIVFALGIKAFVLALSAIGFATMWEAVFADVGVALIAVVNAMRVLHAKPAAWGDTQ